MKKDFAKVIVERPRRGHSQRSGAKGEKRDLQRLPLDALAMRQSMRAPYGYNERKETHERLAPLRRYLSSQVGRPWDQVYSDICHVAKGDMINGRKLIDSLRWEGDQNVNIVDGVLVGRWGYTVGGGELFVHPESGLLSRAETRPRRRWLPQTRFEIVVDDALHRYVKLDGIWYFVTLAAIPGEEVTERPYDMVLKESPFPKHLQPAWGNEFTRNWGAPLYAAEKRQANKREIQRLAAGPVPHGKSGKGRAFVRPRPR